MNSGNTINSVMSKCVCSTLKIRRRTLLTNASTRRGTMAFM